jgi:molybdate transport system regulatory protein
LYSAGYIVAHGKARGKYCPPRACIAADGTIQWGRRFGMTRITVRVRIYFGPTLAIGPGRIELLEGVQRTGSLSQAARDMGMSYRRAWLLMQSLNHSLRSPASIAVRGGRRGGGATVTPMGRTLIQAYRRTEARVGRNVSARFAKFARTTAAATKTPDRVRAATRRR